MAPKSERVDEKTLRKPVDESQKADVTVLVVAYNHERYIEECLESIRCQTVSPARVIVADDASPDRTVEVLEGYMRAHPGFVEFRPNQANIGLNRTLNKNLRAVTTEYFTYISADDVMLPHRIDKQVNVMSASPRAALCYSDAIVLDSGSHMIFDSSRVEYPWPSRVEDWTNPYAALLDANWMPAASLFLRTEKLRAAGGYHDDLFYEDFELLVRLSKDHEFVWTDEALVGVRRLDDSLGATGFSATSWRFLVALDAALRHYDSAPAPLRKRAHAARWEIAKRAAGTNATSREALKMLWDARSGASSVFAVAGHLGRTVLRRGRKHLSTVGAGRG